MESCQTLTIPKNDYERNTVTLSYGNRANPNYAIIGNFDYNLKLGSLILDYFTAFSKGTEHTYECIQ